MRKLMSQIVSNCDKYSRGREGQYQLGSYHAGILKVALVTSSFEFDPDIHKFFSDVTGEVEGFGYEAGGKRIIQRIPYYKAIDYGLVSLSFEDTTWPYSAITARGAIIYEFTGTVSTGRILDYRDFGADKSSGLGFDGPTSPADFIIQWR